MNAVTNQGRAGTGRAIGDVISGAEFTKSRRTGQPVWRNSYYTGQIEQRIFRPFMGGDRRKARRAIGVMLKAARQMERTTRRQIQAEKPGARNGVLGQIGLDVLEVLLLQFLDYKNGRLDPAISTIAEAVGHSYAAVHRALVRLRRAGFLQWVRRSEPIEDPMPGGPQVRQITNAYIPLLPAPIQRLVTHLMRRPPLPDDARHLKDERKRQTEEMLASLGTADFVAATWSGDSLLGETLKNIAVLLETRESSRS